MKKSIIAIFMFVLAAFQIQGQNISRPISGQYIVVLKETSARPVVKHQRTNTDRLLKEQLNSNTRTNNLSKVREVSAKSHVKSSSILTEYADVIVGFSAKLSDDELKSLKTNPDVAGIYTDYEIKLAATDISDECIEETAMATQTTTCAITKAGGATDGTTKTTWIWVLDTGIDLDHPDLNVQTNATYAKSFIAGQNVNDLHGHGTHVSGIAAAKNNGFGVVGVSAGAKVVPVKVLSNSGTGSFSGLLSGLNHVAQYDIAGDVVNLSIGAYPTFNCENSNPTLRDAIRALGNAGTHVVMAAGNDSGNANKNLPGCINGTRIYTVGSITCNNACSGFSNWGTPSVDWVAVGTDVFSTYKGGVYTSMSGTSMAAPVVAGIIHSKGGAPVSGGNVICGGSNNKIAKR